jgi:hypothetical protein
MSEELNSTKGAHPIPKQILGEMLSDLAKKAMQVKLLVGYADSLNGYGWHVKYHVEVFKTEKARVLINHYYPNFKEQQNKI